MPTPKYVCDYCDKTFHDTPASRKRHMQGITHQRAVKAWYDSFRDKDQGGNRGVCAYFQRTGTCNYGSNCQYAHITHSGPSYAAAGMSVSNISQSDLGPSPTNAAHGAPSATSASVPVSRVAENKLPPSLQPPPEDGYPSLPFVDWG
ncbi:U11/U12 small nuclear ribonucleoprotein 20 kDa protein [Marchantia polymorpha subsp. ruderalis]|uniref:C3H1-type domain-containing protein n=2 Tax=Marchantia polymorpha TaxID=3197 RepID=A0AAF6BA74_MARPO|nr:hypothetical protein MARPO_0054s0011 [Marchantia polymorpha]BBN08908.1 hypothetical protein Mp_4g15460 [Marchantia polymorpha subsp. ruderalis]|eukprot:PTQ37894.1 hypothetical protein MARPO_0054s0011 [Marchantia polymorpha]